MARDKGQSKFSSNFEVKISEMLDPRLLVDTKEELINKETWPYDGNTIYMKEGMFVYVKGDGFYELVSLANILATDYSGWKKVTSGAEGGSDVYFSDMLDEDAIMTIISGGAYLLFDTSKVEEFIANAKGKIVLFNNKNNSSIVIPYIYFFEDSFYFSYCGVNTHNDELGIWHIQYLNGQFTLYNSAVFSDYQKKLVSGTNIKTINNTSILGSGNIAVQSPLVNGTNIKTINGNGILGEGNLVVKAYYPKTFVTIDEFPESVTLIPTEYTIIETVINGGFTISCKGSTNMNKRADEHLIRFSYSSGSISFGNNIRWQNETAPTFKSGYTYEISILDNLACFAEFKTA